MSDNATASAPVVRLDNLCSAQRQAWVDFAIRGDHPLASKLALRLHSRAGGAPLLAVRSRSVREESVIFRAFVPFEEAESTVLAECEELPGATNLPVEPPLHPWTVDRPTDALIRCQVKVGGAWLSAANHQIALQQRRVNASERVIIQRSTLPRGFHCWVKLGFNAGVVVHEFSFDVSWSTDQDDRLDTYIEGMRFVSGEPLTVHQGHRYGMESVSQWNGREWVLEVSGPRMMGHGSSIWGWGNLISLPADGNFGELKPDGKEAAAWRDIQAALCPLPQTAGLMQGEHWNGAWLAYRFIPGLLDRDGNFGPPEFAEQEWRRWLAWVTPRGDLYDARLLGVQPRSAMTGDQEGFGASYGTAAVTCGDPRWLLFARSSYGEPLRGSHWTETSGAPFRSDEHPGLISWSGRIALRASSDRFGKALYGPSGAFQESRATGWSGMDDEHRSQLLRQSLMVLTGCELLERHAIALVEVDRAMLNDHVGVTRSSGRLFGAWANDLLVLPAEVGVRLTQRIRERRGTILRSWRGAHHTNDIAPITVNAPSGSNNIRDPDTGEDLPVVAVWEHGLWLVGAIALAKVTSDSDLEEVAFRVGSWIARFGTVEDDDGNILAMIKRQWYPDMGQGSEGQPLAAELRRPGSWAITYGVDGTTDWTLAGLAAWGNQLLPRYGDADERLAYERIVQRFGLDQVPVFDAYANPRAYRRAQWLATRDAVEVAPHRDLD